MFEKLKEAIRRRRDPARMREEDEDRRRAGEELRQAELRKTEDHRGVEGVQRGMPFGRP
jgi:hypothetical protein